MVANCDHLARLKFSPVLPYVFTEHGAIMAANVLNSPRAVAMSVHVVRAFVRLREMIASHKELAKRLDAHPAVSTARYPGLGGLVAFAALWYQSNQGATGSEPAFGGTYIEGVAGAPSRVNPLVPVSLDRIVIRAMQKAAADRYRTATELAEAIEGVVVPPRAAQGRTTPLRERFRKFQTTVGLRC